MLWRHATHGRTNMTIHHDVLFDALKIDGLQLANRAVVSPMTRVSATPDGRATAQMAEYYRRFARGGFGLVITEGVYPDAAHSQGYENQPGIATDQQAEAWRPVVDAVHAEGVPIMMQLMHAGALVQYNRFIDQPVGPSAVEPRGEQMAMYRGHGTYTTPEALTEAGIIEIIDGFVAAARRARAVGFDGVEIHGANGYLLDGFLTDYSNRRCDDWGGGVGARVRMPARVLQSVRDALGNDYPIGIRLSQTKVNDMEHRWAGAEDDAALIFRTMAEAGASYLHLTGAGVVEPAYADDGPNLTAIARQRGGGIPVMTNGGLHDPDAALAMMADDGAALVSVGRGALANPDWPRRVRDGGALREFSMDMLSPVADLDSQAAWETGQPDVFEPLSGAGA